MGAKTSLATKKRTAAKTFNSIALIKGQCYRECTTDENRRWEGREQEEGAVYQHTHLIALNGGMSAQKYEKREK
jgi:hypothetical protein